jgi:hypothetical protein
VKAVGYFSERPDGGGKWKETLCQSVNRTRFVSIQVSRKRKKVLEFSREIDCLQFELFSLVSVHWTVS